MPISVVCPSCSGKLKVPDHLAGRKVKCPKCGGAVPTEEAPAVSEAIVESAKVSKAPAKAHRHSEKEAIQPGIEGFKVQEAEEPPPEDEEPVEQPKKKKKKKKRKERPPASMPVWVIWLAALGGFMMLASVSAAWAIHAGHGILVLEWGVYLVVMLPVSTVILIVSMIISSQLAGGIDFGEVQVVIPKAIGLLLFVNVIGLIPYGGWVTFPIWLFGLMFLFHLDLWESRLLIAINWILNFWAGILVWMIVIAILVSASPTISDVGSDSRPARSAISKEQESALEGIDVLGGDYEWDEESDKPVVIRVVLTDTAATDSTLATLKQFRKLRSLELAGTRITDAGLAEIKELKDLEVLDLSRTRVTDAGLGNLKELKRLKSVSLTGTQVGNAGVQSLQQALPQVRINR